MSRQRSDEKSAFIFDLDNTICDTIAAIQSSIKVCYKYLKNHYLDIQYDEFMSIEEDVFNYLTIEKRLPVYSFRAIYWHTIFERLNLSKNPILIKNVISLYSDQLAKSVELFPGIENLLFELKKRNKIIAILSNGDFLTKASMIEYLNISQYVDLLVASDMTQVDKPDPRAFRYVLDQINLAPSKCVFVGDERINDIEGAKKVGLTSVYVKWPPKNKEKFIPDVINVNSPYEILSLA